MSYFKELKTLCDKATEGPWYSAYKSPVSFPHIYGNIGNPHNNDVNICETSDAGGITQEDDAEFITAARTALPLLLKALDSACLRLAEVSCNAMEECPDYWLDQVERSET